MLFQKAAATVIVILILITAYLLVELSNTKMALERSRRSLLPGEEIGEVKSVKNNKNKAEAEIQRLREEIELLKKKARAAKSTSTSNTSENALLSSVSGKEQLLDLLYTSDPASRLKVLESLGLAPSTEDYARMMDAMVKSKNLSWNAMNPILSEWFKLDPDSLIDWVIALDSSNKNGDQTLQGMSMSILSMVGNLFPNNTLEKAADFISKLQDGNSKEQIISSLIFKYAASNPEVAREWFDTMKNENFKVNAVMALARGLAQKNTQEAITWLESLPDGILKNNAYVSFITEYSQKDPEDAIRMAESIKDENSYIYAVSNAIAQITSKDPGKAGEILKKYPAGTLKDRCCQNYIYNIARDFPETAALWVDEISDNAQKQNMLVYVANTWMCRADKRDSFEEWFRKVELPSNIRDQIQKQYNTIKNVPQSGDQPVFGNRPGK